MDNICLGCALCCDGTIFATLTLRDGESAEHLAASGANLLNVAGRTTFRQPCAAKGEGCCSIYVDRPLVCREYDCELRRRHNAGEVSFDHARSLIASVIELRDRIRPELARFLDAPGPPALADIFPVLKAGAGGAASALRAHDQHADFLVDVAALRFLLLRHFEISRWNPQEASRPDAGA